MESSDLDCTHEVHITVDTTDNLDSVTLDLSLSSIDSDGVLNVSLGEGKIVKNSEENNNENKTGDIKEQISKDCSDMDNVCEESDYVNCTAEVDFTVDTTNDLEFLLENTLEVENNMQENKNENKEQEDTKGNEVCSNKMEGGGDPSDKTDSSHVDKQSDAKPGDIIKTYPVKLPMKGDRFLVKVVDSCNVPHKLFLKNTDKIEKRKLNMLLAKKSLEPLTCMPMSELEERTYVLVKFRKPAKLLRAQVKWIVNDQKIDVQDIDSGSVYRVTCQDIFVLDDEQIAHIYPRLFVCSLSEFDGKDIYWNSMIRDLYMSTLRSSQVAIEVITCHQALQTYEVNIKLLLDKKKFINLNEWLANSLIPYLVFLKTCPASQQTFAKQPPEDIFFPYVKLLKE